MKNIALFIFFGSLFACKNVEQFKAPIADLSTKWETATNDIAGFAKIVDGENAKVAEAIKSTEIDATILNKLKPEQKTAIETATGNVKKAGANLGTLMTEISSYVGDWTAKGNELTKLKDGLTAGKLEGDVAGKIEELTKLVTDSGSKLTSWKEAFSKAQTESNAAQTALATAMEVVNKMAPVKK